MSIRSSKHQGQTYIFIKKFKGVNIANSPWYVSEEDVGALSVGTNVIFDRNDILRTRYGLTQKTSNPLSSPIDCIHYFIYDKVNNKKQYLVTSGHKLYKVVQDASDWSFSLIGNLTGTNRPTIFSSEALFDGKAIIASGGRLQSYDYTNLETITGVSLPDFTSNDGTLDDLSAQGTYTGTADYTDYVVKIDAKGNPDTFKWSDDGGDTWEATGVAITGNWQDLNKGIQIKFDNTTGHEVGDYWTFRAYYAPKAKWVIMQTASLVISGDPDAPSYVYASGVGDETGWYVDNPVNWAKRIDTGNVIGLTSAGDYVIAFCRDPEEINLLDFVDCKLRQLVKGVSAINHYSIVTIGSFVFIIDNDGIKQIALGRSTGKSRLSDPIGENFVSPDEDHAFAFYYPPHAQLWFILENSNYAWCYHVIHKTWTKLTFSINITSAYYNPDAQELILGGSDGHLYLYDPDNFIESFDVEITTKFFEADPLNEALYDVLEYTFEKLRPGTITAYAVDELENEIEIGSTTFGGYGRGTYGSGNYGEG